MDMQNQFPVSFEDDVCAGVMPLRLGQGNTETINGA